jgi:hypothetical protein
MEVHKKAEEPIKRNYEEIGNLLNIRKSIKEG